MTDTTEKKRPSRVALTKKQKESALGIELLSVCQSIAEDGKLTDEEIEELQCWLIRNREENLPAISFLSDLIMKILADGIVTESERLELFRGIERVLPKDLRGLVSGKRKEVGAEERAKKKEAKEEERRAKKEERERNIIVSSYDFMVAGARRRENQEIIESSVREGDKVFLVRDPDNSADKNAVEVHTSIGETFGFVPREDAKRLAFELDSGCLYKAHVKAVIGYKYDIPVVRINTYRSDSTLDDLVSSDFNPESSGCLIIFMALCLGLIAPPVLLIFLV